MSILRSLTPEQRFLLREARGVWRERGTAKDSGLPWQEETITDIFLKRLKRRYPGVVEVIPFNKQMEGESGADWLWSFVSEDGASSMTMLVQAKRLDDREVGYPDISRTIGQRTPPERQIDKLIEVADRYQVPALYAFYNHLGDTSRVPRRCGSLPRAARAHVDGFGISVADAEIVRQALPDTTFDTHATASFPLHCLLCSFGTGQKPRGGSPEAIIRSLRQFLGERLRATRRRADPDDQEMLGFQRGDHSIVARARAARDALARGVPAAEFDLPAIAGVVVMKDAKPEHVS